MSLRLLQQLQETSRVHSRYEPYVAADDLESLVLVMEYSVLQKLYNDERQRTAEEGGPVIDAINTVLEERFEVQPIEQLINTRCTQRPFYWIDNEEIKPLLEPFPSLHELFDTLHFFFREFAPAYNPLPSRVPPEYRGWSRKTQELNHEYLCRLINKGIAGM